VIKQRLLMQHKILLLLTASVVILTICVIIFVSFFIGQSGIEMEHRSKRVLSDQTEIYLKLLVGSMALALDAKLDNAKKSALSGARSLESNFDKTDIHEKYLPEAVEMIETSYFVSPAKDLIVKTKNKRLIEKFLSVDILNASFFPALQDFKTNKENFIWTNVHLNPFSTLSDPVVDAVAQVTTDATVTGYVGVSVSLTDIAREFNRSLPILSSYFFLINKDLQLACGPPHARLDLASSKNFMPRGIISLKDTGNEKLNEILKNMSLGQTYHEKVTIKGVPKYITYAPLKSIDWMMAVVVPVSTATAASEELVKIIDDGKKKTLQGILVWAVFLLIVILFIGFAFARKLFSPFQHMIDVAKQISGGNLTIRIKVQANDEVSILGGALNRMLDAIESSASEIEKNRNYIANIIDSMPSVLVGVDSDGIITQWNNEAARKSDVSHDDAVGRPLIQIIPHFSEKMELIHKALRERIEQHDPKNTRRDNEINVYEDITVYPLIANGVEGAVIRIDDVSEKVHMEEILIQNEKMLSVGGLAAGMAHEINNPIAGMMQTTNVMNNRLTDFTMPANITAAEEIGIRIEDVNAFMEKRGILRMLSTIKESGIRVAEIVDNMLTFARKSDSSFTPCDLGYLISKTLELASTDFDLKKEYDFKSIRIIREYEAGLAHVPCEEAKIQQVLLNLFRNGAQAMQEAGIKNPCFIVRIKGEELRKMVAIEIEDNGPGMNESTRKRIFEPFFTTKPVGVGTGLGLSVSYFIITENHGGEMTVKSSPGNGAKFIIHLPIP